MASFFHWAPKVFPTTVGMNRQNQIPQIHHLSVPHDRGDEPLTRIDIAFDD